MDEEMLNDLFVKTQQDRLSFDTKRVNKANFDLSEGIAAFLLVTDGEKAPPVYLSVREAISALDHVISLLAEEDKKSDILSAIIGISASIQLELLGDRNPSSEPSSN